MFKQPRNDLNMFEHFLKLFEGDLIVITIKY